MAGRPKGSKTRRGIQRSTLLDPALQDQHRAGIQTGMIISRLTNFVRGEIEMTTGQITAALGLLRKTLPDLAQVQLDANVNVAQIAVAPEQVESVEAWEKEYGSETAH